MRGERLVPVTPFSRFRLPEGILGELDALAAALGGVRTSAVKDAITYRHRPRADAGRANARDLSPEDWGILASITVPAGRKGNGKVTDWARHLAAQLGAMEGPDGQALARRVASWGLVRGYALYACLAHRQRRRGDDIAWWSPAVWMTPTARDDAT
jgi:hypothetical protein